MTEELTRLKDELQALTDGLAEQEFFKEGYELIVGCSTSEIQGKHIGKSSSDEIAEIIFKHFKSVSDEYGIHLIFQGCEHINRALTMEREVALKRGYTEVSVVPHKGAGGSLSGYAYHHLNDAIVVENVSASIGIDIGQTLIGMHLKEVAVPVRTKVRTIGEANVTIASSRPKLIGGKRAHY